VDALRYAIALLVVVGFPPALVFWLLVHPFARRWRRLGPAASLAVLYAALVAAMLGLVLARDRLVVGDLGPSALSAGLGLVCFAASIALFRGVRRALPLRVQMGIPELTETTADDRLLTEGIYARIRHPRYVQLWLALLAWALFANYLAAYAVALAALPLLRLVVALEERELRQRFGSEYEAYRRRVPRFIPRPLAD
jgi:protein-S-isoprenylcysteine O-methyltransferase Ste14